MRLHLECKISDKAIPAKPCISHRHFSIPFFNIPFDCFTDFYFRNILVRQSRWWISLFTVVTERCRGCHHEIVLTQLKKNYWGMIWYCYNLIQFCNMQSKDGLLTFVLFKHLWHFCFKYNFNKCISVAIGNTQPILIPCSACSSLSTEGTRTYRYGLHLTNSVGHSSLWEGHLTQSFSRNGICLLYCHLASFLLLVLRT